MAGDCSRFFMGMQLWGDCGLLFRYRGSVLPQAMMVAVPSACLAAALHIVFRANDPTLFDMSEEQGIWSSLSFVLGVLIVFRTNQAYSRFWEGATLLYQVKGEWFNATSSVFAFCSSDTSKQTDVSLMQHHLVRLVSMLYCAALQTFSTVPAETMEIIDLDGLDGYSLEYLESGVDRCEVVLQWVQRMIVENMRSGVIDVPAPILSRVFQELSRGIVNVRNVQKIAEVPFPFPYTQMIVVMLCAHTGLTVVLTGFVCTTFWWAGVATFLTVLAFWSMNCIAAEIENPFGEDENDLPIADMNRGMNRSLLALLNTETQNYPHFSPPAGLDALDRDVGVSACGEVHYGTRVLEKRMTALPSRAEFRLRYSEAVGVGDAGRAHAGEASLSSRSLGSRPSVRSPQSPTSSRSSFRPRVRTSVGTSRRLQVVEMPPTAALAGAECSVPKMSLDESSINTGIDASRGDGRVDEDPPEMQVARSVALPAPPRARAESHKDSEGDVYEYGSRECVL